MLYYYKNATITYKSSGFNFDLGVEMKKKGILLINLGTPDSPTVKSVRNYLKEFLNDPCVIHLPFVIRWLLVNLIIIPLKKKKSALNYKKIWTKFGSPLRIYSEELKDKLRGILGEDYQVELGMRYGNPSIKSSLDKLKNCDKIIILPLFPQYCFEVTGSIIKNVLELIIKKKNIQNINLINSFYNHSGFITAYSKLIENNINIKTDFVLFSYHGLPSNYINNNFYYKNQCITTSKLLAKSYLDLKKIPYETSFQSRLGYTSWIKPYTDVILEELIERGIRNIVVCCPSFVVDCLETLEEINIRARKKWQNLGGSTFTLVPCLNSEELWLKGLKDILISC